MAEKGRFVESMPKRSFVTGYRINMRRLGGDIHDVNRYFVAVDDRPVNCNDNSSRFGNFVFTHPLLLLYNIL